jgi:tetrahydromethanopterin S-methyltransferase subunit E
MTVTFGRLGKAFLLAGAGAAVLALAAYLALTGTPRWVTAMVFGILAVVALVQGVVWTALQHRMFGSPATLHRVAESGHQRIATVESVASTGGRIGGEPIARLGLRIDGALVERRVRVPFNYASMLRPGATLPVRVDPAGSRAMVVEWSRVP